MYASRKYGCLQHPPSQRTKHDKVSSKTNNTQTTKAPRMHKEKRSFHDQVLYTMLISSRPYTLKSLAKACYTTSEALNHPMLSFLDEQLVICKESPSKKGEKKLYRTNPMSTSEMCKKSAVGWELLKLLALKEGMTEAETGRNIK